LVIEMRKLECLPLLSIKVAPSASHTNGPATRAELFSQSTRLVYHCCKRYLRWARAVGIDIEDLHQEAMMGLFKAAHAFNPNHGARFSSFACATIRHRLHNLLTRRRFRALKPLATDFEGNVVEHEDVNALAPDALALLADDRESVARMLRLLLPRERVIVQMYFWNELSFALIGKQLGLSGERVRQIFERAMQRMRLAANRPGERGASGPC
jgi:RNA polymerase sigma factor (sigma-70 family)